MDAGPLDTSHDAVIWLAGPRLLGLFFNWGLLGILTAQVYIYFINFPEDRRVFKVLIYAIYLLDWAQTCSATYDAFQWFVYGWGDINVLNNLETGFLNIPILSSIVAITVQIFFGWRIWTFSKSFVPLIFIVILAVAQLGGAIAVAYFIKTNPLENAREAGLPDAVGVRLGTSVVADAIIAISMTYFLLKSREEAIKLNNVLTRLVRLTIETGTVTAMFAIMDLVFFLAAHNGLHEVSGVILAKLYTNSLLVIFNNRLLMASKSFNVHGRHRMHEELENRNRMTISTGMVFGTGMRGAEESADSGETSVGAGAPLHADKEKGAVQMVTSVDVEKDDVQIPIHAYIPAGSPSSSSMPDDKSKPQWFGAQAV